MSVDYIGCKVHLTTEDGLYEGRVHNVDLIQKKISLKKVIVLPAGKELTGIHNFFSTDIVVLKVVDTSDLPDKVSSTTSTASERNSYAEHSEHIDNSEPVRYDSLPSDNAYYADKVHQRTKKPSKRVYEASDVFMIRTLDDRYYEAIEDLKQQSEVGFSMEGIDLGRNGTLSLVQFSTKDKIYMFDVKCLGRNAFSSGIVDVIENEKIVKVIHDCRPHSDLLYHKYGLNLKNVFDTVVADVVVWKRKNHGNLPRAVMSLPACMMEYLEDIDQETIQFMKVQENWIKNDPQLWEERPLDCRLLRYADTKVRRLLQLRNRQMYMMMEDFRNGVQEYLSAWRDKTSTREKEQVSAYASVPKSVNRPQPNVTVQLKQEENSERYFDRDVMTEPSYWSRDAWKEGRQFHEDDDNEKYAWYREMQSQQASAAIGVAAGFEKDNSNYELTSNSRKPYKQQTHNVKERIKVGRRQNIRSDHGAVMTSKQNKNPDPIVESDDSVINNGIETCQPVTITNNGSSSQSSSDIPSSSDTEVLTTATSADSSPYRSPYRTLSNYLKNESSDKKHISQISKLTLKDISRDFKVASHQTPPLISSNICHSSLEEDPREGCVPSFGQSPDTPKSYATAVSGKASICRAESPNPSKGFTGRGRGKTIQYYRDIPGNFQRNEESPVPTLQGNAVRCDFPSDNIVKNAPRGITVSSDCRVFGMMTS